MPNSVLGYQSLCRDILEPLFPLHGQAVTEASTVRGDIATNYEMRVQLSRKLTNTENVLRT